jgi:hypothetical protein
MIVIESAGDSRNTQPEYYYTRNNKKKYQPTTLTGKNRAERQCKY